MASLRSIHETAGPVTVRYWAGDDEWELGEQADLIAAASGIRVGSNKELTVIAVADGGVVGAVWTAFEPDRDASDHYGSRIYRYDLDVAVAPAARGAGLTSARVGPRLIEAALADYDARAAEVDGAYIETQVVNGKLARWLQDRYGFEPTGREWSPGAPHLVYHGRQR